MTIFFPFFFTQNATQIVGIGFIFAFILFFPSVKYTKLIISISSALTTGLFLSSSLTKQMDDDDDDEKKKWRNRWYLFTYAVSVI